jgi:hypothetical protein
MCNQPAGPKISVANPDASEIKHFVQMVMVLWCMTVFLSETSQFQSILSKGESLPVNAAALDAERDAEVDGGPLRVRMAAVTAHLTHTSIITVI